MGGHKQRRPLLDRFNDWMETSLRDIHEDAERRLGKEIDVDDGAFAHTRELYEQQARRKERRKTNRFRRLDRFYDRLLGPDRNGSVTRPIERVEPEPAPRPTGIVIELKIDEDGTITSDVPGVTVEVTPA